MPTISSQEARQFYDRFGAKQDDQGFYEAPALDDLLAHGDFAHARAVFELGCGTGRLARTLLERHLPATATYRGIDISSTMVALATEKLSAFSGRAAVAVAAGEGDLAIASDSVDRFVSTYVLDLLPPERIRAMVREAHRVLAPGGLLCLAGITPGTTALSRVVMGLWNALFRVAPAKLGGCRPIRVAGYLVPGEWRIEHHRVVVAYGIASEVVVAARR